jgi:TolA-binding protein
MARFTTFDAGEFALIFACELVRVAYNAALMNFIFRRLLPCAFALTAQLAVAADTPTNAPAAKAASTNTPTATSTNAGARILSMRSELREINTKLRELQNQCTNAPQVQAAMTEYEAARQELQSVNKKLQELQQRLQDTVVAEIVKKDPSAKKLIDRRQELLNEIKATHPPMTGAPRMGGSGTQPMTIPTVPQAAPPATPAPTEKK